jgi:SAM-dependent methyltransferase
MVNESPLAAPPPWDLVSSAYAAEVMPMLESYATEALRLAAPAAGSRVVDVACGPGTLAVLAARAGHPVDALDFSPKMIDLLNARIGAEHLDTITPYVGDGEALPFPDHRFGAGFSMFGLMFFPDRARGFAELARVLAPGARAVVSSWHPLEATPALAAMFGAVRELMAALAPSGAHPEGPPLTTEAACRAEMSASFTDVEVHTFRHTQRYPSTIELWQSIQRTMAPIALLRDKLGPDRWRDADARVGAAMTRVLGEGPSELSMPAWLTVGTAR